MFISQYRLIVIVNEILGDHNVDKQITDNKGDVRTCDLILNILTDRV